LDQKPLGGILVKDIQTVQQVHHGYEQNCNATGESEADHGRMMTKVKLVLTLSCVALAALNAITLAMMVALEPTGIKRIGRRWLPRGDARRILQPRWPTGTFTRWNHVPIPW
jgi:hypothetical protein